MKNKLILIAIIGLLSITNTVNAQINVNQGGTGKTVLPSNQILFGSTALRIASDPLFVWATSTGRLGIGTTTPYASLSVSGGSTSSDTLLALNNRFRFQGDGVMKWGVTANAGLLSWGANNAIVGSQSGYDLSLYANGGEKMKITTGGLVGISSTTPYASLSVTNTGSNPSFVVEDSTSPDTSPFIVDASGNVGVGTAAPSEKLSLYGASGLSRSMTLSNDTTYYKLLETLNYSGSDSYNMGLGGDIFLQYDGPAGNRTTTLGVNHASGEVIINGNVGIGTTTPISKLGIQDTAGAFITLNSSDTALIDGDILGGLDFYSLDTSTGMSGVWGKIRYEADSTWDGTVDDGADLIFSARTVADGSLQDKMVLKASGNVGIGTTSPGTSKLSVGGSSYLGGAVYATSTVTFTGLTGATGGTNQDVCINTSGILINETTGTCVVSSERFKNNIVPLKIEGLPNILKLKPVEYSYNEDDVSDYKDRQYGFTAEAVAKVDPHFAKYGTDGLPRTLDDRALLAASVKAIQELKAEVDSLKAEVKLLKSNKK